MASRLTLRVQERLASLTKSEQRLGRVILEHQGIVETHTATELAALASVSKATAARFFRALGYSDFEEVKTQAREERNRTQPFQYSVGSARRIPQSRVLTNHLEIELDNLTRTFEQTGTEKLKQATDLINNAPTVWLLGLGLEEGLARHAKVVFSRLRHNVHLLGNNGEAWAEDLAMTGPKDALILITLAPRPRLLRSLLSYAKTTHMKIITLTDHAYLARAQQFSSVVLPCHVSSVDRTPSHTALISILRVLGYAYQLHSPKATEQRLDIIEQIHDELNDIE